MDKLTEQQVESLMQTHSEWKLDGKSIHRRYKFSGFPDAIRFVNRVADQAEELNHHPFISIDYKVVSLRLTTWSAGGLTSLDFEEAERFDQLYLNMEKVEEEGNF